MTAEQLEELMGKVTQGEWRSSSGHTQQNGQMYWQVENEYDAIMQNQFCWAQGDHAANATLIALAPTLARKVITAERIIKAIRGVHLDFFSDDDADEYRDAIAAWESAQ